MDRQLPTIAESLTKLARSANLLATEADSTQTTELALIVARVAHEAAAIYRLHQQLEKDAFAYVNTMIESHRKED